MLQYKNIIECCKALQHFFYLDMLKVYNDLKKEKIGTIYMQTIKINWQKIAKILS